MATSKILTLEEARFNEKLDVTKILFDLDKSRGQIRVLQPELWEGMRDSMIEVPPVATRSCTVWEDGSMPLFIYHGLFQTK
jgi:hypothetical protein